MTDKELLELAAKAAGIEVWPHGNRKISPELIFATKKGNWNPLTSNADAFQLMVLLNFEVDVQNSITDVYTGNFHVTESHLGDKLASTRRAIVMAAAEIGKGM